MRFSNLLLSFFVLSICSCKPGNNLGAAPSVGQMNDITNRSLCGGQSVPGLNIFSNDWEYQLAGQGFTNLWYFHFESQNNSLIVTNNCGNGSESVTAQVSAPIKLYGVNGLQIVQSVQNSTQSGDRLLSCYVNVNAAVMTYNFSGPCLIMQVNGQTIELVPAF